MVTLMPNEATDQQQVNDTVVLVIVVHVALDIVIIIIFVVVAVVFPVVAIVMADAAVVVHSISRECLAPAISCGNSLYPPFSTAPDH